MSFKINDDDTISVMCDVCGGMLKESDGTLETYKAQRDAVFPDRESATALCGLPVGRTTRFALHGIIPMIP